MATAWHMVLGGTLLAVVAAAGDAGSGGAAHALSEFTPSDVASMCYVSLLGGAASYGIFFYNASRGNLTALSSLTFLTPVFAAGAGYVCLGEVLTPVQLAGAAVTLSAVSLINWKPKEPGEPGAARASEGGPVAREQQQQLGGGNKWEGQGNSRDEGQRQLAPVMAGDGRQRRRQ